MNEKIEYAGGGRASRGAGAEQGTAAEDEEEGPVVDRTGTRE